VTDGDRPLIEEHAISERRGFLGGKKLGSNSEGKFEKTTFLVTCDYCGRYPLDVFVMCKSCRAKLCDECAAKLEGRPYCRACLMEILPVSANTFKVLLCIDSSIRSSGKISDITRIPKDEVKASLALLRELKLIESKGMLAFLERKVTADGLRTLFAYRKVYGNDEDVRQVEEELAGEAGNGT